MRRLAKQVIDSSCSLFSTEGEKGARKKKQRLTTAAAVARYLTCSFSDGDGDDNSGSSDRMSNDSDINASFLTLGHSLEYAKMVATGMPSFNQSTVAVNREIQLGKDGQTPGQLLRLLEQGMPSSLLSCDWKVASIIL